MIDINNLESKIYDADITEFINPLNEYLSSLKYVKNAENAMSKRLHNYKIICSNYGLLMSMFNQYFNFIYSWPPEQYTESEDDDLYSINSIFPNNLAQCNPHLKGKFKAICLGGLQIKGHIYLIIGIKGKYASWMYNCVKPVYTFALVNPKQFKNCLDIKYISF